MPGSGDPVRAARLSVPYLAAVPGQSRAPGEAGGPDTISADYERCAHKHKDI